MSSPTARKTNAARLLDGLGVPYELRSYAVDPEDLSAGAVARKIGLPVAQVFKTLVTQTPEGVCFFAVLPGDLELDLKKLAAAAGVRKVELAPLKQVETLTGYVRGGVTVFAARKPFSAFVHRSVEEFDTISVSAGQRGLQLLLAPPDYLRAAQSQSTVVLSDLARLAGEAKS